MTHETEHKMHYLIEFILYNSAFTLNGKMLLHDWISNLGTDSIKFNQLLRQPVLCLELIVKNLICILSVERVVLRPNTANIAPNTCTVICKKANALLL